MTQAAKNKMYTKLGQVTSNDWEEYDEMLVALQKALPDHPNSTVEFEVDVISMWDKVEFTYTVAELAEYVGLTVDTDLTVKVKPVKVKEIDYTIDNFYYVDIPQLFNGKPSDEWRSVKEFKTRKAAINYAKKHFGADDDGKVSLVTG